MEPDEPKPSQSEVRLLRVLAGGNEDYVPLDWVAIQHLKQKGLVEETPAGPKLTAKGKLAISKP